MHHIGVQYRRAEPAHHPIDGHMGKHTVRLDPDGPIRVHCTFFSEEHMKNIHVLALAMLAAVSLSLTACDRDQDDQAGDNAAVTTPAEQSAAPAEQAEPAAKPAEQGEASEQNESSEPAEQPAAPASTPANM